MTTVDSQTSLSISQREGWRIPVVCLGYCCVAGNGHSVGPRPVNCLGTSSAVRRLDRQDRKIDHLLVLSRIRDLTEIWCFFVAANYRIKVSRICAPRAEVVCVLGTAERLSSGSQKAGLAVKSWACWLAGMSVSTLVASAAPTASDARPFSTKRIPDGHIQFASEQRATTGTRSNDSDFFQKNQRGQRIILYL